MTVTERAAKYHCGGCNCAQSVLCALSDYTGMDECTAKSVAAGFGGGARCGELCGAISGGIMAIGLAAGKACGANGKPAGDVSRRTAELTKAFRAAHGCVRCQELTMRYGGKGHCGKMIEAAAEMTENILKNQI